MMGAIGTMLLFAWLAWFYWWQRGTVADAMEEPHTQARQLIVETDHPHFGTVRSLASPVRVGDPSDVVYRRAPLRNEDAAYVLEDILGYSNDTIERLAGDGAFGKEPSGT